MRFDRNDGFEQHAGRAGFVLTETAG